MGGYNILIYGSGNCEVGGKLSEAFEALEHIEAGKAVKVFGRAHIFNQSCLNMYGRFDEIKSCIDLAGKSGQGGIYEYFYDGNQTIKTCEMKIQPVTIESFSQFLSIGKERMAGSEIILVLMGQGSLRGMFMDFASEVPGALNYEELFNCIEENLGPEVSRVHLIIDMLEWHYINLPLLLSRHSIFKSVFIYKRPQIGELFPVERFVQDVERLGTYNALRQKDIAGYNINLSSARAFEKLEKLWEAYQNKALADEMLIQQYKKLVQEIHAEPIGEKDLKKLSAIGVNDSLKGIKDYFKRQYGIIVDEQNLNEWLEGLKICTDYHKL